MGGYCLTKDPLLASWAKQNFFKSSDGLVFSEDSVTINDQMPKNLLLIFLETPIKNL